MNDFSALMRFIYTAEKLKAELRHSWTSRTERQESVAEHSWLMALIAMAIFDSLDVKVDQLRVLKMVALHDLAEAITGDIPSFDTSGRRDNKYQNEHDAMQKITADLPAKTAAEFMELWEEVEAKQTPEAMLAQCLDKIEVLIEHIIADISTWDEGDYSLGPYNKEDYFDFNPYVREFKDHVNLLFWEKMETAGVMQHVPETHKARRKQTK